MLDLDGDLPGATTLARALLVLARSRATGILTVRSRLGVARLAIDGGAIVAAQSHHEEEPIGDLLSRAGEVDMDAHRRALEAEPPSAPIGRWLVRHGVTSEASLAVALRRQLRRRVGRLMRDAPLDLSFERGRPVTAAEPVPEPVPAAELVLSAMRHEVARHGVARIRRALGEGPLELSPLGSALVREAPLWPDELAMLPMLRTGAHVGDLLAVAGGSSRATRALFTLRLLGAVTPPSPGRHTFRLLLRKQRQVSRNAAWNELLDLPPDARPTQARRALRRLARELHPDRFGATPPALRRASGDVLSALVRAEARARG